jgi:uncharacterized membrane protein YgdD (TMEM256/DUF423 family)
MKFVTKWKYKAVHCLEAACLIIGAFLANDILKFYYESENTTVENYAKYKLYHAIFIFVFDMIILIAFEIVFRESP